VKRNWQRASKVLKKLKKPKSQWLEVGGQRKQVPEGAKSSNTTHETATARNWEKSQFPLDLVLEKKLGGGA